MNTPELEVSLRRAMTRIASSTGEDSLGWRGAAAPARWRSGDLCDIVHRETGTPTICWPHREDAPIYAAKVCCAGDSCFPTAAAHDRVEARGHQRVAAAEQGDVEGLAVHATDAACVPEEPEPMPDFEWEGTSITIWGFDTLLS